MKTILLLFTLSYCYLVSSQEYVPFPTQNASWTKVYQAAPCSQMKYCYLTESITNGKFIADNKEYTTFYFYSKDPLGQIKEGDSYLRFRNVVDQKQVMVYLEGEEHILYDFNLRVGDTTSTYNYTAVVDSIDSVLIDNNYRKRFYLVPFDLGAYSFYPFHIIEGIGSTNGFSGWPNVVDDFEPDFYALVCHKVDSEVLYSNEIVSDACEDIHTSGITNSSVEPRHLVYPTITNEMVYFETDGVEVPYEMYDISGNHLLAGKGTFIDVSGVSKGVYFIKFLHDSNVPYVQQIIIN